MRNSVPCGLAIGSQRASSSQGHLPLTRDEKLNTTTRSIAKDLAAITAVRKHQPSVMEGMGDWKQGNCVSFYKRNEMFYYSDYWDAEI